MDRTAHAEVLVERFLATWSGHTLKAYNSDLHDFARFRSRTLAAAVGDLLVSREQCQRLVLEFAVDLARRGRAPATMRRRLTTLSALTELARELGMAEWSLETPSAEEVAAAGAIARIKGDPYFLPRGDAEIDRLDVQHYALREALGGSNHLASLERPARILDVGCGTGQWAYELCAEFPESLVFGFDLQRSKAPWPTNYRFVRGNLLHGLPFTDGTFDFVHQRFLASGVPVRAWARTMRELVRVTTSGGWIELVEARPCMTAGPATERLFETTWKLGRSMGLDTTGQIARNLAQQLRRNGVTVINVRRIEIPVGEWGGRVGSWMSTDARTVFLRLAGILEERFGLAEAECRILVATAQQEWEEHRTLSSFTLAVGRK